MDIPKIEALDMTLEELAEHDRVLGGLTEATRAFADAQLRTVVDLAEAEAVTELLTELTARLSARLRPGGLGTTRTPDGQARADGNPVMGLRNPFATLRSGGRTVHGPGHVSYSVDLGPMHEGWPGHAFGGVTAMLIDQVVGDAVASANAAGMTATLTITYVKPLHLGHVTIDAVVESIEGRKARVKAEIRDADGAACVRGEALMIVPRWAMDRTDWRLDQRME